MGHDSRSPNRVRELRENRLMTQAQLARKAKVALRTIHSVEKGMNCRMDTKRKILLALGLRFEDKDHVFPRLARERGRLPAHAASDVVGTLASLIPTPPAQFGTIAPDGRTVAQPPYAQAISRGPRA